MSAASEESALPHLRGALLALGATVLLLLVSVPAFAWATRGRTRDLLQIPLALKNQGEVLQRAAFAQENMLPVYGSSELMVPVPNRVDEFFHPMPTGFQVCPVGWAGSTSLLLAQKVAAVGGGLRGRKMAVILSGTWFCRAGVPDDSYAGNFSPLQAATLLLRRDLDESLRRRFVHRMRHFKGTLEAHPVHAAFLRHAGAEGAWSAAARGFVRPLLGLERGLLWWEDRFAIANAALNFARVRPPGAGTEARGADFERLIAEAERAEPPEPDRDEKTRAGDNDAIFIADLNASREWLDLELLLDTLKFYGARVMVLSVPIPGRHFDAKGVSREARDHYYRRLQATCAARGFPCESFSDHDHDRGFLIPGSSHFTARGWLYVDRVLDAFYHDRPLAAPAAGPPQAH